MEWIEADNCDVKFHLEIIERKMREPPAEPYIIRLYYPNAAKNFLKKQVKFDEITLQYELISSFKDPKAVQRYTNIWKNGRIPVEIIRDRGISVYAISQDCMITRDVKNGHLMVEKMPELNMRLWLENFRKTYEKDGNVDEVKTMVNRDLESYCNNVVMNSDKVPNWMEKHELIVTASFTIMAYCDLPLTKQFSEMCFDVMFANYYIIEELFEWLPTDVYDAIHTKIMEARNKFKAAVQKTDELPGYLKNLFLTLASMEYIKSQFDKVEEPILEPTKSDIETKVIGFKNLLKECNIN